MAIVHPPSALNEIVRRFKLPNSNSHKGDNGKLLIIGGSSLFHAAVLWSAEVASHFVDIVHFSSTKENEKIFLNLKSKFRNGIVIKKNELMNYANEDDSILIGPGMLRGKGAEAESTRSLTDKLISSYPNKKFIIDAGAMQTMDPALLIKLSQKAVITPHQKEFEMLFGINIKQMSNNEKKKKVSEMARRFKCIILLKSVVDIVTDGDRVVTIEGGNAGLTKGGTGDTLAGLTAALSTTNDSFDSAVLASFILKSTAEELETTNGIWFNTTELIAKIPETVAKLLM